MKKGSKAPEAAGRIHGDMERGFIMAETMKFEDLKELGTEAECKAKGKYTQNGKNYLVQVWILGLLHFIHCTLSSVCCASPPFFQDGDIFFFKFNVTTKGK